MLFAHRAALVCGLLFLLFPSRVWAEDTKAECVRAFEAAQRARLKSKLVEAKAELRICSRESCPTLVHGPCTGWLREVEAAMPSVVVSVRTQDGDDVPSARVSIDGRPVRLSGTAIELSPGEHVIRVEAKGRGRVERTLIVNASEKNRLVSLILPATPGRRRQATKERAQPAGVSWPYWVGALGVVAVGAGVTLDMIGTQKLANLREDCAPNCSESKVSSTRTTIIAGDSLIAGGLIAVGIATYGLVTSSNEQGTSSATR